MTRTTTIDWKGGRRQIELREPHPMTLMHIHATVPEPITMRPNHIGWVNRVIAKGSEFDEETVETIPLETGFDLFGKILTYWVDAGLIPDGNPDEDDDEELFDGLNLNDEGAVDLEDMR